MEEIRQSRETLNRLATDAGRDPSTIQVMAFGASGADRVTIWLDNTEGSRALREMEEIARRCWTKTQSQSWLMVKAADHEPWQRRKKGGSRTALFDRL